jgi:hypothetical protein
LFGPIEIDGEKEHKPLYSSMKKRSGFSTSADYALKNNLLSAAKKLTAGS